MRAFLWAALLIAVLALIFALQNSTSVSVRFLFWEFAGSLALVLLITLVLGALIATLALLPALLRRRKAPPAPSGQAQASRRSPSAPPSASDGG